MDLALKPTDGLATGMVIQLADGYWHHKFSALGSGLAMTEEAFDLLEPLLREAWQDWDKPGLGGGRYGVSEIPASARRKLAAALSVAAQSSGLQEEECTFFSTLASWFGERLGQEQRVTLLGL